MPKVLVTGASGFIGATLVRRLVERGDRVACLVRATSNTAALAALQVELRVGDMRDSVSLVSAVAEVDIVYHLAGLVAALSSRDLMQINATAVAQLAQACAARQTPPTLLVVSSLAAAGPSSAGQPRSECDPPAPVSNYGRSKLTGEAAVAACAAQVPITIVRPPIVFGPGDQLMRPLFRSIQRYGIHVALGVARSRYAMISVDDLADALVTCAERGRRLLPAAAAAAAPCPAQGIYFVAHDQQPTFAELGSLIGKGMGRARVRVLGSNRRLLLWPAAAMTEVYSHVCRRPHIFNFDKVREARAGNWTCSTQTICRELGYRTSGTLADRLAETSAWYLRQGWL